MTHFSGNKNITEGLSERRSECFNMLEILLFCIKSVSLCSGL